MSDFELGSKVCNVELKKDSSKFIFRAAGTYGTVVLKDAQFVTLQKDSRKIKLKSSFLRVHYDVSKYISTLQTAINGFKTQFDQLEAKGKGMEMIYDNCINQLQRQKSNLMAVVLKQTGFLVSNFTAISEDALKNEICKSSA